MLFRSKISIRPCGHRVLLKFSFYVAEALRGGTNRVLSADAACTIEAGCPGQAQRSIIEITVSKRVGEAVAIKVILC
mgnify:CR=1 FL=1